MEKYLSSPPAVLELESESTKNSNLLKTALNNTNIINESLSSKKLKNGFKDNGLRDQNTKHSSLLNVNSTSKNNISQNQFTKLSEVVAEDEDEDLQEQEVEEVNGLRKKMPRRIDSDSPEISDFIKRREQAEKENLKWIESQRQNPHLNEEI